VIHELPIAQLLALSCCAAWAHGMEPSQGTYEDFEMDRAIGRVKARRLSRAKSNNP